MKKFILAIAIMSGLSATQVNSQSRTSFGIKAEANISNFIINDMPAYKSSFSAGAGIGAFIKIDFGKYFALQPELLFHLQNSILEQNGTKHDFRYWGIEVPLYAMGQLTTSNGGKAYLGLGPYGKLGLSAKNTSTDLNLYKKNGGDKPFMQRGDVGVAAIIGYEFGFGMQINVNYKYGLINQLDVESDNSFLRNQMISLGIAYRF